jgi:5-methylcytosine-specific restriction endonuclease McrA
MSRCTVCRRLHAGVGRCAACNRRARSTVTAFYNSPEWAQARDRVLSEEPLCRSCRAAVPSVVDHVIGLRRAWHLRLARSNLQALCAPCHNAKTWRETH